MKGILITSFLLIVLIAALRPLLRGRIDPRLQYALWLTVALRLLIPVNLFTSAYSALALLQRADRGTELVETIGQAHIPAQSYDSARAQVVEEYRRQGVSDSQLTPGDLMAIDTQARELMKGPTLAELAAKCARPVWLGGAALMALWFTAVNLKLRRRLRGAEWIEADCPLPVYVSDALPSPCLVGTVRPKIYVTPAALESPGRLRHVLAHELAHYRHKDHWWALVRCACLCLYWFHPLVWWAAALSRQDCELACDEGAIRALGEGERIPYGRTLVGMIAAGRTPLLQTATTMTGGKRRVKERVTLIARKPKTVIALALAAALILGCAVGCAFSGAPEKPMDAQRKPQLLELPSRLNDIPEELQPQVVNRPEDVSVLGTDGVLASYWWDVPADWEYDFMPWLLAVYQWDQTRLEEHLHPQGNGGYGAFDDVIVFAQDNDGHYFVFNQPTAGRFKMEGAEEYTAAFQAIRAFAEKKVLETEGVEPYNPSAQPLDTLQDRLLAVPEDWKDDVVSRVIDAAVDGGVAVGYSMNRPEWEELDAGLGWLLNIQQISRREYEAHIGRDNSGWACFARSGDTYFAVTFPTDVRFYSPDDAEPYHNAQDAVWAFVEKTVLSTQGVEPYTLGASFPDYTLDGMDYTPVNSYEDLPDDPEQWFLVGQLPGEPVWMFSRNRGQETMFQVGDRLTQVYPFVARCFGGGQTHDGHPPQLMRLEGGSGPDGTYGTFAVLTHTFQGGADQLYQLTAYDLDTDPQPTAHIHDWIPLMDDFNAKRTMTVDEERRVLILSYGGQTCEITYMDDLWENYLEHGFSAQLYEYGMKYTFNSDGTANLIMAIEGPPTHCACWTVRFANGSFETVGFQFIETPANYW
mgnify:CR=1 FL=1